MKRKSLAVILILMMACLMLAGCNLFAPKFAVIDFESNGGTPVELIEAKVGSIVNAPDPPMREGYEFAGWYTDKELTTLYTFGVMGEDSIKLYAKWERNVYFVTLNGLGGTGTDIASYRKGVATPLPTDWTREGYLFAGWYETEDYSTDRVEEIYSVEGGDKVYYAKWVQGDYVVTLNGNGGKGSPLDSYNRLSGATLPTDWTREGYTFAGWYESETFAGNKVTAISKSDRGDKVFYAKWDAIEYTITFDSNGGSSVADMVAPYGSAIIEPIPTMTDRVFDGWYTDEALTKRFNFTSMPLGGAKLYAKWIVGFEIKYVSNGVTVKVDKVGRETIAFINPELYAFNEPDSIFDGWYFDHAFTSPCGDTLDVTSSTMVYAKWISRSFMDRQTAYDNAIDNDLVLEIDDRADFIKYMDYVMFRNKVGTVKFKLNYVEYSKTWDPKKISDTFATEILDVYQKRLTAANLPSILYTAWTSGHSELTINDDQIKTDYTKIPNQSIGLYDKVEYGLVPVYTPQRDANFDSFKYKSYKNSIAVETSDQLFYALQHGIKPIVKPHTKAYSILADAESVAREIMDDSMSDFDKVYAIYCWFIENVYYDHTAAETGLKDSKAASKYDAWHLEGVFNNRSDAKHRAAVCDGISKAFTVLARIEGIPTIRVISSNHAWNKVYLDLDGDGVREWYALDATWGNTAITNEKKEIASVGDFLFTDAYKEDRKQTANNYLDIKADNAVNPFDEVSYSVNGKEYDLYLDSETEVVALMQYLHDIANDNGAKSLTIDITADKTIASSLDAYIRNGCNKANSKKLTDRDFTGLISSIKDELNANRKQIVFNFR